MTANDQSTDENSLGENLPSRDQVAVKHYFQSSTYHRTAHQIDPYTAETLAPQSQQVEALAPVIDNQMFDWPHTKMQSRLGAWLGQGCLLWILAAMVPIAIEIIESFSFIRSSDFVTISLMSQTLALPVMSSFAFAIIFCMLWHRSLAIRFAIASITFLMALASFCSLFVVVMGENDQEVTRVMNEIFPALFAHFLASCLVGLGVQLFTPWTLIEKGVNHHSAAPTGMQWMIELTAISALCFAVLVNLDLNENLAALFIFFGMSVGASFVALSAIRTWLSRRNVQPWLKVVSPSLALAYTLFFNGMMAIDQYKNSIKIQDAFIILAVSIYGAGIVMAVSFAHIRIAKACGWTFISRGKKTARDDDRVASSRF